MVRHALISVIALRYNLLQNYKHVFFLKYVSLLEFLLEYVGFIGIYKFNYNID